MLFAIRKGGVIMHIMMDMVIIIGLTLERDIIMNGISFWIDRSMKMVVQSI